MKLDLVGTKDQPEYEGGESNDDKNCAEDLENTAQDATEKAATKPLTTATTPRTIFSSHGL